MNELFEITGSKSPRLLWMDMHGVWAGVVEYDHAGPTEPEDRWQATAAGLTGTGPTEDAAIVELAKRMGINLWNEEGAV